MGMFSHRILFASAKKPYDFSIFTSTTQGLSDCFVKRFMFELTALAF